MVYYYAMLPHWRNSTITTMTDYPGQHRLYTQTDEYNTQQFMIERQIAKISTATLVVVQSVTTTGQVAAVGEVDVKPLVKMVDGVGTTYAHGPVHGLSYFRLQGGNKAIIMDPKVGDIGAAIYADRDISTVKKTKQVSPPASYRRFDMADAMFFPCFLGAAPTSYVQFKDDGSIVLSPDNGTTTVTIDNAGKVQVKVGAFKFSIQPLRMDLNCDYGAGTNHVMSDAGPIGNVWCIP